MTHHTPNNGYFTPITSRLPGEDFEAFVARDWKARVVHERGLAEHVTPEHRADRYQKVIDRANERRRNMLEIIGDGEVDARTIYATLEAQGEKRTQKSMRHYLAQLEGEGLLASTTARDGKANVKMWRVVK